MWLERIKKPEGRNGLEMLITLTFLPNFSCFEFEKIAITVFCDFGENQNHQCFYFHVMNDVKILGTHVQPPYDFESTA